MRIIADIVMFGWIPIVLMAFAVLPPRRAVIYAYLCGWLFLPFHSYSLPVFPDFTKMSATTCGVLLGAIVFDFPRFASYRFRWVDLPMAVFCVVPFLSSVTNNLGAYDGVSGVMEHIVTWGLPYFVGRLFLGDAEGLRKLAIAIFIGGLIYIPFCWFEIRMSPQLHNLVYGSHHRWGIGLRLGGYRPSVFLDSGLQLGFWMTCSSLIGFWLWRTGSLTRLRNVSIRWLTPILLLTTAMCRSTGALALLIMGIAALEFSRAMNTRFALWCLLLTAPLYLATRITGVWSGDQITNWASLIDKDRANSFQFRLDNEDILVERALQKPLFGWGGWNRNRVLDDRGNDISVTDGRWIIELGIHGFVGMVSLYVVLLLPLGLLMTKTSLLRLMSPDMAPALSLGIVVVLYAIDCLPNGMSNPVIILAAGGVVGYAATNRIFEENADGTPSDSSEKQPIPAVLRRRLTSGRVA